MTSLSFETHSPALFVAHTICALVGVGMTPSTSFQAKGKIRKQNIQLTIKLSTTFYKLFERELKPSACALGACPTKPWRRRELAEVKGSI